MSYSKNIHKFNWIFMNFSSRAFTFFLCIFAIQIYFSFHTRQGVVILKFEKLI